MFVKYAWSCPRQLDNCIKISFQILQWNIVRLLIVSDVINVRLNDGENMKATLQDSPVRPDSLHVTHDKEESRWWGHLWRKEGEDAHPDAPGETVTRKTRAILASITGNLALGRFKDKPGFRGTYKGGACVGRGVNFNLTESMQVFIAIYWHRIL